MRSVLSRSRGRALRGVCAGAALALLLCAAPAGGAAASAPPEAPSAHPSTARAVRGIPGEIPRSADPRVAAWQRLRYGMFIHWGLFSELGGVWKGKPVTEGYSEQIQMWANISGKEYAEVADRFRADRFDPGAVCALAKDAGMKYVVITAKHHDGFAMFDTGTTDYDVVDRTPYGKDPLRALARECRAQGLEFGVYFSLVDWHAGHSFDPDNSNPIPASMEPLIEGQLRELMTGYGPIAEVWFDMSAPTAAQSRRFARLVHRLQPGATVSSRVWNNAGDFRVMGDNEVPDVPLDGAWQTPASVYHETWGYRSWQRREDKPGKIRSLVRGLLSVRARGGNYLLNIGPRGDGSVVGFEADVLRGVGAWLKRHHRAGFEASATRFGGQPWGEVTVDGHELYLHAVRPPSDGRLRLPGLATRVAGVAEDGPGGARLDWHREGDDLVVQLPEHPADPVLPVVRVRLRGPLRLVPDETVDLGADGRGTVTAKDMETGHGYADEGSYRSQRRTTVRSTAYVTTARGGRADVRFAGEADPGTSYRLTVGSRSRTLSGRALMSGKPLSFSLPRDRVVPVTLTRAHPAHPGEDLDARVRRITLTP
ncbi:alpha-L-fucosidase [Streptomyces tubbatahanensis]|uniref:alpha-L-fucosidase n=1 Tax=Streptomyces tubbatahanensis TaxID=2923272 RepID=A0ABY3XSJ1_9ACTN|nr:alpha-L-fucosidase [Streptomyces tubbatahanensis]UNS97398.1 alpha-L-fucosidase [Streptomyces tubbatahanensis]